MFCGLGKEERTKFRKKKNEKKGNKKEQKGTKRKKKGKKKGNKPQRGQTWVGWDERVY